MAPRFPLTLTFLQPLLRRRATAPSGLSSGSIAYPLSPSPLTPFITRRPPVAVAALAPPPTTPELLYDHRLASPKFPTGTLISTGGRRSHHRH
jgi:hypothetical protein